MDIENMPFKEIGIYKIEIIDTVNYSYRILYRYPRISDKEFKLITDDLIIKCNCDINFIVREFEKFGFKELMADGISEYKFI